MKPLPYDKAFLGQGSSCEKSTARESNNMEIRVKAFDIGISPYTCLQWVAESSGDMIKIIS
jgi:hypothetical protein